MPFATRLTAMLTTTPRLRSSREQLPQPVCALAVERLCHMAVDIERRGDLSVPSCSINPSGHIARKLQSGEVVAQVVEACAWES